MDIGFSVVLFIIVGIASFALGTALIAPRSSAGARLRSLLGAEVLPAAKPALSKRMGDALKPLGKLVPKSPDEASRTSLWLMQAGYREPRHMAVYYGIRGLLACVGVVTGIMLNFATRSPVLTAAFAVFGFIVPRFVLKRMIKRRQNEIRLALADALDLAVICVEAGLGLDQAIQRVASDLHHVHPALSDELQLVVLEIRAGRSRPDALRNLTTRTGVDDIRALVAVLVQTDRFGTSVAQALRVHSDSLRTERRQRAEEQAAKTTIKMIPALIFFVFPAMFMVTLGPAFIQLYRNLLPVIEQ